LLFSFTGCVYREKFEALEKGKELIYSGFPRGVQISKVIEGMSISGAFLWYTGTPVNQYMLNKLGKVSYKGNGKDVNCFVDSLLNIIFNGIKNKTCRNLAEVCYKEKN